MNEHLRANSVEDFTRLLAKSRLVSEPRTTELANLFHEECFPPSYSADAITSFCNFIVSTGEVTAWQCEKLRKGQWKGFFDLTGFVVLDDLGPDSHFGYFLAKDLSDGGLVRIAVRPGMWTREHGFDFRVVERLGINEADDDG